jgi:ribosomal protein L12E/L44/L45/RPP1/RPP2
VIEALRGKTIHQLIAEGQGRLGSASAAPSNKGEKKDAPKKEEKKEEPKKK